MKKQPLFLLFWLIIVIFSCFSISYAAETTAKNNTNEYINAVIDICTINQLPIDNEFISMIYQFESLKPDDEKSKIQALLFNQIRIQAWGNWVSEYLATMELIYSFKDADEKQRYQIRFGKAIKLLDEWRNAVNQLVEKYHPGYQLKASKLRHDFKGQGVTIAVFDLFEPSLLAKQRKLFPSADIQELIRFGDPVSQAHGNSVIDIILTLAPYASILPITADHLHENNALRYIADHQEIHIINMSRAFAEKDKKIDPEFSSLLSDISKQKIVVKSLGNTGTDLYGQLTPIREEKNLPVPGNPFAYDLTLIRQFITQHPSSLILFAINSNLINSNIALTATIPGDFIPVVQKSFAVAGDGVWSQSSENFESGSSFSAPQLSALCAMLWQAINQKTNTKNKAELIIKALSETAEPFEKLKPQITGLGTVHADRALRRMTGTSSCKY